MIEEPPPPERSPAPTQTCTVTKDANGFFDRGAYVGFVPPAYDGTSPMRLLVGLHGCGDTAKNFATWAVAPWDTRKAQHHIGISIGGKDGKCWANGDESAVLAAIEDLASCYWVDRQEIVMGGFSSGGEIGYHIAMKHTDVFAGLLVEDASFYTSTDEASLLANTTYKMPIAHIAHQSDTVFPIAKVQADWTKILSAGFPLTTSVVAGDHNGTSADWSSFLLPVDGHLAAGVKRRAAR